MGEPLTWLLIVQVHFRLSYVEFMDVVRIFSKGGSPGNFPKIFLGGTKIGEICFFPLETKKKPCLDTFSKSRRPYPLPTPMGEFTVITRFMHQFSKRCNG